MSNPFSKGKPHPKARPYCRVKPAEVPDGFVTVTTAPASAANSEALTTAVTCICKASCEHLLADETTSANGRGGTLTVIF
jgi:hypothetical protein